MAARRSVDVWRAVSSLHRRIHQVPQHRADGFALAGALHHEHGEQIFRWIDPEERPGHAAPEELADRAHEMRNARLGAHGEAEAETMAGGHQRALDLHLGAEMIG